jgi:hypothetical protein
MRKAMASVLLAAGKHELAVPNRYCRPEQVRRWRCALSLGEWGHMSVEADL